MLPRSRSGEEKHAQHKRELEISIAIRSVSRYLKVRSSYKENDILILEFGSGGGFQTQYLQYLGRVVACDLYTVEKIKI